MLPLSWHGLMIYRVQLRSPHTGPTLALTTAHSIAKSDGQASASMAISTLMIPLAVDCRKSTKPCEAQWGAHRELARLAHKGLVSLRFPHSFLPPQSCISEWWLRDASDMLNAPSLPESPGQQFSPGCESQTRATTAMY